ncbi:uncharacterized protein LOC142226224 [Haematobia irritans]|uniref:uncharacterized protein LOC142226224 n=1 Tax=Haematobia irritans TaxID=7368 RepID=UPI003F50D2A1
MLAELNELTNSSSSATKTVSTNLSPISTTDDIQPIFEEIIVTPSTSPSTSTYGERTPTPPFSGLIKRSSIQHQVLAYQQQIFYPHSQLETDDDDEGVTITEIVEVHRIPSAALFSIADNNNPSPLTTTTPSITTAPTTTTGNSNDDDADIESNVNNNNTSCSLSSTLTDSKTLDVRTPIVV